MNENNNFINQDEQYNSTQTSEKMFTQDDVNRIIGERLLKEKEKFDKDYQEKIQAYKLDLEINSILSDRKLPSEFKDILKYSNIDEFNNVISIIDKYVEDAKKNIKIQGFVPCSSSNVYTATGLASNEMITREAFGLK